MGGWAGGCGRCAAAVLVPAHVRLRCWELRRPAHGRGIATVGCVPQALPGGDDRLKLPAMSTSGPWLFLTCAIRSTVPVVQALLGDDDRLKLRWDEQSDGEVRVAAAAAAAGGSSGGGGGGSRGSSRAQSDRAGRQAGSRGSRSWLRPGRGANLRTWPVPLNVSSPPSSLLPRPQVTKQNLADKIAQLNAAIDDVSSQLNARDAKKDEVAA